MKYYTAGPRTLPNEVYVESMTVIAKEGKLAQASAGGCGWGRVFFRMSEAEYTEFDQAWERHFGR